MLRIRARQARGLWRAGVHHPAQWVEHAQGAFTEQQLAALRAEPMLEMEEVGATHATEPPPAAKPAPRPRKTR